jgi:hypothetical protein
VSCSCLSSYGLSNTRGFSMEYYSDYGDNRKKGFCIHCGGAEETRDHIPSKVLLDEPFPENLPVSPSCRDCNNGFSLDEEYLACLIECVITGEVDPERFERQKIAETLKRNDRLSNRLRGAKRVVNGQVVWDVEMERVKRVLVKLARGHAAYELNEPQKQEPDFVFFKPLTVMSSEECEEFEKEGETALAPWPEVGSGAMQRLLIVGRDVYAEGWLLVQEGRYRYKASQDGCVRVRIVIREYLACEIAWS